MTEDEAFIRAVVDHPGDDTPRLVYADWLDDRSDPRGPYLRAEYEWAKPWRAGDRPADSPEPRELARGLDAVWVARVSRPPLGVCMEHFRLARRLDWPDLTATDLERLQAFAGFRLPTDYAAFLLNHNGGFTRLPRHTEVALAPAGSGVVRKFRIVGEDWSSSDVIPGESPRAVDIGLVEMRILTETDLWEGWIEVADWHTTTTGWWGAVVALAVAGDDRGTIVTTDSYRGDNVETQRRWDTLASFLVDVFPAYPSY